MEILDHQVKRFRKEEVASVKVLRRNNLFEGATWEAETDMKSRYRHLIPQNLNKVEVSNNSQKNIEFVLLCFNVHIYGKGSC